MDCYADNTGQLSQHHQQQSAKEYRSWNSIFPTALLLWLTD